ncbi:MAG: J domain-containing protein [Clostridia bacterium]
MTNFYEILEVSQNASKEVIEKAYRVLVKKYHPDLQKPEDKVAAEEKMKQINDAYDTLMDEEKRNAYDEELKMQRKRQLQEQEQQWREKQDRVQTQESNIERVYKQETNGEPIPLTKEQIKWQEKTRRQAAKEINKEIQNAYAKAYNDYWRSRGYRVKEPWTWKRVGDLFKVLAIIIIIMVAIWFFPPTHDWLMQFYEQNIIVQTIVNVVIGIVKAIGNGIYTFFTNLPKF